MPGDPGGTGEQRTASSGSGENPGENGEGAAEPGFGTGTSGGQALPDLRDEPTQQGGLPGQGQVMAGAGQSGNGTPGGGTPGGGTPGGGNPGGAPPGDGSDTAGSQAGGGPTGGGPTASNPTGSGPQGPLTPAEQVAILDGRLERGTGEFDAMILEEQAAQRQARRDNPLPEPSQPDEAGGGGGSPYDGGMADAGDYSTGGGMGGASRGGGMPQNTAKYPPPADIPSGDDDDVVARQLREAAMREPDPEIREKLWDEYRKYKGISP